MKKHWTFTINRPPLRTLMEGAAVIAIIRDLEHSPGTQTQEDNRARWERFRWNQIGRLQEKLDALPSPSENGYARVLEKRMQRLRSMK